jgi:hypothetical protein
LVRRVILSTAQDGVHLRQDLSGVRSGCNAENLVLLQIVGAEVAQAIFDLRRKPIQVLVLVHIETLEQVDEFEDIGDQRSMESRLRLVQFVDHVRDHVRQPHPQVLGSPVERLTHTLVDFARNPRRST